MYVGEWKSVFEKARISISFMLAGPITGHRSQVILLGCFSIGKRMTCDLCFVPAGFMHKSNIKSCTKLNGIKLVQCRKNQALCMNHLHV